MTTTRRFCADDLFRFGPTNLDPLTETVSSIDAIGQRCAESSRVGACIATIDISSTLPEALRGVECVQIVCMASVLCAVNAHSHTAPATLLLAVPHGILSGIPDAVA